MKYVLSIVAVILSGCSTTSSYRQGCYDVLHTINYYPVPVIEERDLCEILELQRDADKDSHGTHIH